MTLLGNRRQGKMRWALAVVALVIIIGIMAGIGPRFGGPNVAFADIVQKIRNASTMTFNQIVQVKGLPHDLRIKVMFRAPGAVRREMDDGTIQIQDHAQQKLLTLKGLSKHCILTELSPSGEKEQKGNLIERLRTLPERASQTLPQKQMDGHTVQGYLIHESGNDITLWADAATGDPVRVEYEASNMPGMRMVMTNFQFNVPLADSLFSLTPPAGYIVEKAQTNNTSVTQQDLINFLRFWVTHPRHKDGLFPPSLNPGELAKESKLMETPPDQGTMVERMKADAPLYRWMDFIMPMEKENDWHYDGKGIKFGDASQPIFWWKPKGAKSYRVILGDLSVIDEDLGPAPTGEKIKRPRTR